MPIINVNDAVKIAKDRAKIDDKVLTAIGNYLIKTTFDANFNGGNKYVCIHENTFHVPLMLLEKLLQQEGWKAKYKSEQRDGAWVHVDLPVIGGDK